jgi:hypothetical protein
MKEQYNAVIIRHAAIGNFTIDETNTLSKKDTILRKYSEISPARFEPGKQKLPWKIAVNIN